MSDRNTSPPCAESACGTRPYRNALQPCRPVLSVAIATQNGDTTIASGDWFAVEADFRNIYWGTSVDGQSHASAVACGGLVAAKHLGGIS